MLEFTPVAPSSLTVAGRGAPRSFTPGTDIVIWSRLEQAAVALQGSELVFAGYGIAAREYARDDYAGVDVRGKTVVLLSGDPGPVPGQAATARAHMPGFYARADFKFDEAARRGANAVLLIHDSRTTAAGWDVIAGDAASVRLDRVRSDAPAERLSAQGWLSTEAGKALFAAAGLDYPALVAAASGGGFRAMPLGLHADVLVRQSVRRITSYNVIGVLPGTQHHDEYILYSAHWDHLGVRSTTAGAVTYPGAVDNASGVAGLLQLARSFTRTNPAPGRSIVFMALTGGEAHLAGSAYYVENPSFALADTVADLDLDTLHIGGPTRDVTVFGYGQSELDAYVRSAAALQGRELHGDAEPQFGSYYDSDSFSFASHGVPALYAIGGNDDAARGPQWGRAQRDDYFQHRHHRAGDQYLPDWDLRGTADDLRLYYRVGIMLARGGRFPNWNPGSEFRAAAAQDRGT